LPGRNGRCYAFAPFPCGSTDTTLADPHQLTDHEGTFLSLVLRIQPTTAYQVTKIYEASPVNNFNTSKGKIYPLIRRLTERGLLSKQLVEGDGRGTEALLCTRVGETAVRAWVRQIRDTHVLLDDPLRTKVQSFGLLTREEQIAWIAEAKARLHGKLNELEQYRSEVDAPFKDFLHDNAVSTTRARLDWLDRMLIGIVGSASRD
jgi:DNA-binding PadR family transcriptional regulator